MLDALRERLPPAAAPAETDWPAAEQRLSVALPAELKALVDTYGAGPLGGVVELLSPEARDAHWNLVSHARDQARAGLLSLARDAYGRPLWWRTAGPPDAWTLIGLSDEHELWEFGGSLTELLVAALDGHAPVPLPVVAARPSPHADENLEAGITVEQAIAAMRPRERDPDALTRLLERLPPPSPAPSAADWASVERDIGTPLPGDFRALADRYGTGTIDDTLRLYAPGGGPGALDLRVWMSRQLEAEREASELFLDPLTDEPAYRVWPEPGGLLPWADTPDAVIFHWRTDDGAPEQWPVVVERGDALDPDFWAFDGTATELLEALVAGELQVPQLGGWRPAEPPRFFTVGG
jgi:hypothetical protein